VRCCGRSVKVTNQIVPLPSGWTGKGATRMAELRRNPFHALECIRIEGDRGPASVANVVD
jgi:hypothetical protein